MAGFTTTLGLEEEPPRAGDVGVEGGTGCLCSCEVEFTTDLGLAGELPRAGSGVVEASGQKLLT